MSTVKLRTASTGGVKVVGNTIQDVAILTAGEARTHAFKIDRVMLDQCAAAINAAGRIKVRLTHPDTEDLPHVVGYVTNAKVIGGTVRADLHVLKSSPHSAFVLELAESIPDQFGLSIEASASYLTQNGERYARIEKLVAVDLVGLPAGVSNGLLSQKVSPNMNEKELQELRSLLGLDESATAADIMEAVQALLAEEPDSEDAEPATMSAKSAATVALRAVEHERSRASQIRGLALAMKLPDPTAWAERQIQNGTSFEEAGAIAVQLRQRLDAETTPTGSPIRMNDNTANNGDVLQAATLMHLGRTKLAAKEFKPHILQAAQRLNIRNATDLAHATVKLTGRDTLGRTDNEVIRLAFSTMSLPETLGGSLDRIAAEVYAMAPKTWQSWCGVKTVSSFRTHKALRPYASNSDLAELAPGGVIKHAALEEEFYSYSVNTVARMLSVSRQDIVNDSLSLLADLTSELARQAPRAVADELYKVVLDGIASAFWSSGNLNLLTGAESALTVSGLTAAVTAMRKRRDAANRIISLVPRVLIVSPELEQTARMLINSTTLARASDEDLAPVANPFLEMLTLEVEPRLSDSDFHSAASETHWILAAGPENPCHVVAYLDGKEAPTVEVAETDFQTLGMQMRCYLDFGAASADHRAAVLSTGAE